MRLNPKQEKFCLEYSASGNATDAYRKAYGVMEETTAATNGSKLLRNAKIQARLKELADEIASKKIANAVEMQEKLTSIIRREISDEIFLPNGEKIERQVSIRDILKAIDILARIQGLFVDKREVDIKNAPVIIGGADCLED